MYQDSPLHDQNAPGILKRLLDLLLHHDHGNSDFLAHEQKRFQQLLANQRGQAFERFIQQQQSRTAQKSPRNGQHLLLAAGQLHAAVIAAFGEPREQGVRLVQLAVWTVFEAGQQIFLNRERWKNIPRLRHIPEAEHRALMGGHSGEVGAIKNDLSFGPGRQAHDGSQDGCLADSIAPDDRQTVFVIDRETHSVEHGEPAVSGSHVLEFQQRIGHRQCPR